MQAKAEVWCKYLHNKTYLCVFMYECLVIYTFIGESVYEQSNTWQMTWGKFSLVPSSQFLFLSVKYLIIILLKLL